MYSEKTFGKYSCIRLNRQCFLAYLICHDDGRQNLYVIYITVAVNLDLYRIACRKQQDKVNFGVATFTRKDALKWPGFVALFTGNISAGAIEWQPYCFAAIDIIASVIYHLWIFIGKSF